MADFTPAGVNAIVKGLSGFLRDLGSMDKAIRKTGTSADDSSGAFGKMSSALGGVATVAGGVLVAGVAAATTATVGLGKAGLEAAISYESAFAGVLKTSKGATDEFGNLTQIGKDLRQGFRDLSLEIPVAVEELAQIGELGGQLGIEDKDLLRFSETIAKLAVSTNLTTESAATDIARLNNIYSDEIVDMAENTERLGAVIVELGNTSATTERDIVNFANRIAGSGKIAGLSQPDILAIGAAFSSVGVQAEAGGTAVQKVLLSINDAVSSSGESFVDNTANITKFNDKLIGLQADLVRLEAKTGMSESQMRELSSAFQRGEITAEQWGRQLGDTNREALFNTITKLDETRTTLEQLKASQGQPVEPKALNIFAKTAGLTATEFKKAWEDDAAGAFTLFVEGLGDAGDDAKQILSQLGLEDQRLVKAFLSLASSGDILSEAIETANIEFEEMDALNNEAAQRFKTTESQMTLLKNTFNDVAISIGDILLPKFNMMLTSVSELIEANRPLIISFFEKISSFASDVVPKAIAITQNVFNTLVSFFQTKISPAINKASQSIAPLVKELKENLPSAIEFAKTTMSSILGTIGGMLPTAIGIATSVIKTLIVIIRDKFLPIAKTAFDALVPVFEPVMNALLIMKEFFMLVGSAIKDFFLPPINEAEQTLSPFFSSIAEKMPNITEAFESLGNTFEEVGKPIEGIKSAFNSIDFENIKGGLVGLTESATPLFETIDKNSEIALNAFNSISLVVTELFLPAISSVIEFTKQMATTLAEVLPPALAKAQEFIGIASTFLMTNLPPAIEFVKNVLATLVEFINTEVNIALNMFNVALNAVSSFWQKNGERIKELAFSVFTTISNAVSFLSNEVIPFLLEQLQKIEVFWNENGPLISDAIQVMGDVFLTVAEIIVDHMKLALEGVEAFWEVAKPVFDGLISILLEVGQMIAQVITQDWQGAWESAQTVVNTAISTIFNTVVAFLDQIAIAMGGSLEQIRATWEGVWELIGQAVNLAIDEIVGFVTEERDWEKIGFDAMSSLLTGISKIMLEIISFFEDSSQEWENSVTAIDWKGLGEAVIEQILDGVNKLVDDVKDTFADMAKDAKDAFQKAVNWIKIGVNMVEGMIEGIDKAKEKIFGALSALASGAIRAIKAALGISSPSKVFAEFGRNIVQGLVVGVDQESGSFESVLDNLFDVGRKFSGFGFGAKLETELQPIINFLDQTDKDIEKLDKQIFKLETITDPTEAQMGQLENLLLERDVLIDQFQSTQEIAGPRIGILQGFKQAKQTRSFLEDQLGLFQLINESGIDATDIIENLEFGAKASVDNFVKAQSDILDIINQEIEAQLFAESTLTAVKKSLGENKKQLGFLQMQSSLLETITSNGLEVQKILGDIELGEELQDADLLKIQNRLTAQLIQKEKERLALALEQNETVDESVLQARKFRDLFLQGKLGFNFNGIKVQFGELSSQQDLFFNAQDFHLKQSFENLEAYGRKIKDTQTTSGEFGAIFDTIVQSGLDASEIFQKFDLGEEILPEEFGTLSAKRVLFIQEKLANQILQIEKERLATQISRLATIEEEQALFQQQQEFEQRQADLRFLEQQQDLIADIQEQEFDPAAILGGFQVGIDANQTEFLAAMTRFTEAMIAQVEADLGIASPSKVFAEIGENVSLGLASGIMSLSSAPQNALNDVMSGMLPQVVEAPSSVTNNNIHMVNNINDNLDLALFQNMLMQTI